ncbi:transglycosylase domain-containing protein [Desemzia sp. FAM 24101]|uniref:transglycosylase domain-containing protein n=1 Tax=unclassified Desemzia TaxID=2685243 RepID=UPI0038876D92
MNDSGNNNGPSLWDKISQTGKSVYQESARFIRKSWETFSDEIYPKVRSSVKRTYLSCKKGLKKGWLSFKTFSLALLARIGAFFSSTKESLQNKWTAFQEERKKNNEQTVENEASYADEENMDSTEVSSEDNEKSSTFLGKAVFGFNVAYNVTRNLVIILTILLLIGGAFAGGAGMGLFASLVSGQEPPDYEEMQLAIGNVEQTSTMYYAGGETISDFRSDLKRTNIPLSEISEDVLNGIVATEDEYFWEHPGVVPKAVLRALVQQLLGSSVSSGGSTLTQQLVKQQILSPEVTFERKVNEILIAFRVENYFSKEEILQAYLNVSPFGRNSLGQNIAGVQEAATGIFGVTAKDLTLPQAAFIAGLPQNPITYSPYTNAGEVKEDQSNGFNRKNEVLFRMFREGYITEEEYSSAREYDLTQDFILRQDSEQETNSFAYDAVETEARTIVMEMLYTTDGYTKEEIDADSDLYQQYYERADDDLRLNGYKVYSTIDKSIHDALEKVASEYGPTLGQTKQAPAVYDQDSGSYIQPMEEDPKTGESVPKMVDIQVGSSLVDNATGRIIAFVGGTNYMDNMLNHGLYVERQPGSTIKPILVYAPALENGLITPASMVSDSRLFVPNWSNGRIEGKEVTNVGNVYSGKNVSVRESLVNSMNIPTSRIYLKMLEDNSAPGEYLPLMGIGADAVHPNEYKNAALALGGTGNTEVNDEGVIVSRTYGPTIVEMASAYTTLANKGTHVDAFLIERIENKNGEVIYQHESEATKVFTPETAYMTVDILRGVMENSTVKGTEDLLNFSADIAGKTGTSNDREDIWFIGMTPTVTLSTWMGYDVDNISIETENGVHPSKRNLNFWARLMNAVYENNSTLIGTDKTFVQPEGIVTDTILAETGMKSGEITVPAGSVAAAQQSELQYAKFEERDSNTTPSSWLQDGSKVSISGQTKQEIFASDKVPGTTTYDFLIGSPAHIQNAFWKSKAGSGAQPPSSEENETESEETSPDDENSEE